jgi:GT2 family glycosyltransferase
VTLDIVIVSFNARQDLERCLESLHAAPPALPHRIIVVDNASSDGSPGAVAARWPDVTLLPQDTNLGFARANNAGIRAGRGELILLLNSDTVVPPGAIDALVGRLRAHPDAAAAGPRLVDAHGRPELSFGAMMSPIAEAVQKVRGALVVRGVPAATRWLERRSSQERTVDWVSGACLLVYRADAEAVGLLDERYFKYAEDVDFCAALRARGRAVLFTPAAAVTHLRGRSRAAAPGATQAAYRRSHLAFYEKHHPAWAPLLRAYLRAKGDLPPASSGERNASR